MSRRKNRRTRVDKLAGQLTRRLAFGLFVAACIPPLWSGGGPGWEQDLLHLGTAVFIVAAIQIVTIGLLSRRLSLLLAEKGNQIIEDDVGALWNFPILCAVVTFITALVASVPLLILAANLRGLNPFTFLIEHGVVYALVQAAFSSMVFRISKAEIRRIATDLSWPKGFAHATEKTKSGTGILQSMLISTGGAVLCLAFGAQEIASSTYIQKKLDRYSPLLEAVVKAKQLPPGTAAAPLVETLSPVEKVTPFTLVAGGHIPKALDNAPTKILLAGADRNDQANRIDHRLDLGVRWVSTDKSSKELVGIMVKASDHPLLPAYSIVLMFLAMGVAVLISRRIGASIGKFSRNSVQYLNAIPDNRQDPVPSNLSLESRLLDRTMTEAQREYISSRDRLEGLIEEGRESRDKKSRIFAAMSHDLRSPLNSIIGFTDLLAKGISGDLNPAQKKTIAHISQESERLMVLIGDILDTAKLDADRFELDRQWIPSVELLTECSAGANRLVANKTIDFESRLEPGLPPVKVDKERVARALLGIISRAVDSMNSGTITLKASKVRGYQAGEDLLRVDIIDSGREIGEAERARIIRVFNSIEGVSEEAVGGMGLGLSLARRIVRLHGGEVEVEYTERRELTFTVTLPLDDAGEM